DDVVGRAQRLLPALAPLRREGLAAAARTERLEDQGVVRARLAALRISVPRVPAAGVRRVRRQTAHGALSVEARAVLARRRDPAVRQARAMGDLRSAGGGRLAARLRVPDRRRRLRTMTTAQPDYF